MKIAIVNPPFFKKVNRDYNYCNFDNALHYPIWLSYLTCLLMNKGHEPVLYDLIADDMDLEKSVSRIEFDSPEIIVVQASVHTLEFDLSFMYLLKKRIDSVKIIVVGDLPTISPGSLLVDNKFIDFVCIGFFDYSVLQIIDYIKTDKLDFASIPGTGFRRADEGIEVNCSRNFGLPDLSGKKLSHVYRKFLNYRKYSFEGSLSPVIAVQTSRGCDSLCSYCVNARIFCNDERIEFPVNDVISELDHIVENFSEIREIYFDDINFHSSSKRTLDICRAIKKKKYPFQWSANVCPDIDVKVLQEMKSSGCRMLNVGLESLDPSVLELYNRNVDIPSVTDFIENCINLDITLNAFFMIGSPLEKRYNLRMILDMVKKYRKVNFIVQRLVVFPNTVLFKEASEDLILAEKTYENLKYYTIERPEFTSEHMKTFMRLFENQKVSFPVIKEIKNFLFN